MSLTLNTLFRCQDHVTIFMRLSENLNSSNVLLLAAILAPLAAVLAPLAAVLAPLAAVLAPLAAVLAPLAAVLPPCSWARVDNVSRAFGSL